MVSASVSFQLRSDRNSRLLAEYMLRCSKIYFLLRKQGRKEGRKERRKEGSKERKKEGKKERKKERKKG